MFEMCNNGLVEVENPSKTMLNGRPLDASGSVVVCSMEGTRPILIGDSGIGITNKLSDAEKNSSWN